MTTKNKTLEDRVKAIESKLNKQTTRVLVIQDKSGSMGNRVSETIDGYNEYINGLKSDDSDDAYLTLVQFDNQYEVIEEGKPVADLIPLNNDTYSVRGATALLDAVGRGISDLKKEMHKGERALVVIMTDGGENASREYSKHAVNDLIASCEKDGNWTFIFLGAGQDAWSGGDLLGLRRNQAVFYGNDGHSHQSAYSSLGGMTKGFRRGAGMAVAASGTVTSDLMAQEGTSVVVENDAEKGTSNDGEREGP